MEEDRGHGARGACAYALEVCLLEAEMTLAATKQTLFFGALSPLPTAPPQGHPVLEKKKTKKKQQPCRDRAPAAPKAAQFLLDNSNLDQICPMLSQNLPPWRFTP